MGKFSPESSPPGTGKTSTICGLVDAVLAARSQPAVAVHAGRNGVSIDKGIAKKILVCAPSNAAIDELAYRLKKGSRTSSKVVRVGADRSINISVKDISLNTLIENKMNSEKITSGDSTSQMAALREEIELVKRVRMRSRSSTHGG
jgi:senataxin